MWLRHRPLYIELKRLFNEEKVIGDVFRETKDFASDIGLADLPATSRDRHLSLGAGSLLGYWRLLADMDDACAERSPSWSRGEALHHGSPDAWRWH